MDRLDSKLNYYYEMLEKYIKLNDRCKDNEFQFRIDGLNIQIEALENLKNDVNNEWDECYAEDLNEYENRRNI